MPSIHPPQPHSAFFAPGEWADRDKLEPKHFQKWVDFCKERGLGCDFNPTFFSHPKCDPLTLSSPNEETRKFWIDHGNACIRISSYLAEELGQPCVMNIWTGDGFKDIPGDRLGPRERYRASINEILSESYDFDQVKPCIESKEIAREIVRCGPNRVHIALDYFDASINRVSAWTVGYRNLQKSLLFALLQPNEELKSLQDKDNWTKLMVAQEELKTAPFGVIWDEYCRRCAVPADGEWFQAVQKYEADVLSKRG